MIPRPSGLFHRGGFHLLGLGDNLDRPPDGLQALARDDLHLVHAQPLDAILAGLEAEDGDGVGLERDAAAVAVDQEGLADARHDVAGGHGAEDGLGVLLRRLGFRRCGGGSGLRRDLRVGGQGGRAEYYGLGDWLGRRGGDGFPGEYQDLGEEIL